jgi:signal transduction histidine kinase
MAPVGLPHPIAAIGAYWGTKRRPTDDEVQALETMARAAAVALENTRLRGELTRALAEAKAAESAKAAFLATMSREIRTPLSGVATLIDLLDRTQLDERQRQLCAVLKTSSEDVVQLVCDILDFAKLEAGHSTLYNTPFDLEAAVRVAAAPHAVAAMDKGLTFEIKIAPEAKGLFKGDGMRVQQIVSALAANAVKYTDRGGVAVKLEEEERVGIRSMFKLSVTDTGLGFDETTAGALFDRFTQGQAARGGLGLGLAIADAIAQAMGGQISATASSGLGSLFTVRLPLERPLEEVEAEHGPGAVRELQRLRVDG